MDHCREASDWILSNDEHGLERSRAGSLQHLDKGRSFVSWKFAFPLFRDPFALCAVGDGLCSRKKLGDGSHFDRALVIIFFGERGKATARRIQLPYQKKEIEEGQTPTVALLASQQELPGHDHDPACSCRRFGCPHKRIRLDPGRCLELLPRDLL